MIAYGSLEKLPQRNSHRIFSRVDGLPGLSVTDDNPCCVLQQPALVNAFQISAGAMSSDPADQVFLQELRRHFAHALGVRHKAS
jgi:hypothetical protein